MQTASLRECALSDTCQDAANPGPNFLSLSLPNSAAVTQATVQGSLPINTNKRS